MIVTKGIIREVTFIESDSSGTYFEEKTHQKAHWGTFSKLLCSAQLS